VSQLHGITQSVQLRDATGRVLGRSKQRMLRSSDIVTLLRQGLVRFVVAKCGEPLQRIPPFQSYDFWKTEVKPRIVETETFDRADFPGGYCYVASEWMDGQSLPVVLLEMYH
jgi:hypothetical protein